MNDDSERWKAVGKWQAVFIGAMKKELLSRTSVLLG